MHLFAGRIEKDLQFITCFCCGVIYRIARPAATAARSRFSSA
jgi:hypothetical protein